MSTTFASTPASAATPDAGAAAETAEPTRFALTPQAALAPLATLVGLCGVLLFAYWEVLSETAVAWSQPQYSHGWIIPLIALFIMWVRRPNKRLGTIDAVHPYAGRAMAGLGALAGVGYLQGWPLVPGLALGALCLTALVVCLVDQPFSTPSVSRGSDRRITAALWVLMAASVATMAGAVFSRSLGFVVSPLLPGYLQLLSLMLLCGGGFVVSGFVASGARPGTAELAFGLVVMGLSIASWLYATPVDMIPLKRFTFITALFGAFAMIGGLRLIWWAGPAVAFVLFMYPLPHIIEHTALLKFQNIAVTGSRVVLTMLGCYVEQQENTLRVEGIPMEVVEACSGLSMTTILIAMAVAMVLLVKRPWWDRLIILLTAVPIAIISNVFRIVATALIWIAADMLVTMSPESAASTRNVLHDYAGILLMMPFALGIYWLEFRLLSMLTTPEEGIEMQSGKVLGTPAMR
ncbi:MAG: exosortase/archaeosortase family protein [Planctomycetota bacterium]